MQISNSYSGEKQMKTIMKLPHHTTKLAKVTKSVYTQCWQKTGGNRISYPPQWRLINWWNHFGKQLWPSQDKNVPHSLYPDNPTPSCMFWTETLAHVHQDTWTSLDKWRWGCIHTEYSGVENMNPPQLHASSRWASRPWCWGKETKSGHTLYVSIYMCAKTGKMKQYIV